MCICYGLRQKYREVKALELASRGYPIAVNGSSDKAACQRVAHEITQAGGSAVVAMGDIGNRQQALAIVEQAIDAFGAVDVLVNKAAILPCFDLLNGDEAEFQKVIDVNFYSCLYQLISHCLILFLGVTAPWSLDHVNRESIGWQKHVSQSGHTTLKHAAGSLIRKKDSYYSVKSHCCR